MTDTENVLKHYGEPYHRHIPTKTDDFCFLKIGRAENPLCNDWIRCWVRVSALDIDKRIIGVWWEGEGCCFSQAAASMLAEHLEGMLLEDARAFTEDDMLDLFRFDVDSERTECVMTSLHSFQNSLEDIP
jgi:nitrogen fixation NifU-like protein